NRFRTYVTAGLLEETGSSREINDRGVGCRGTPRQEQIGRNPLITIRRSKTDLFLFPIGRGIVYGLYPRIQLSGIIGIQASVDSKDSFRNGSFFCVVARKCRDRAREVGGESGAIPHAAKARNRRTAKRWFSVLRGKH